MSNPMQSSTKEAPLPWYARPYVDLQRLLPQHLLSSLMHKITRSRWTPLKDLLIRKVVDFYKVDMSQAVQPDLKAYDSFNAFFTRELKPEARPLADAQDAILCPADGALSQAGTIQDGRLLQAKGRDFSLLELLGGDAQWAQAFAGGKFATVYLSPRDYHRVHMPLGGELRKMLHIPGRLFSVNPTTTRLVPSLFARNERVVCLFDTAAGPMAIILVGAIFVASIDTVWAGAVAPASRRVATWHYGEQLAKPIELARGQEMGRFNMGSTVILLYGPEQMDWLDTLQAGTELRMGAQIGRYHATE